MSSEATNRANDIQINYVSHEPFSSELTAGSGHSVPQMLGKTQQILKFMLQHSASAVVEWNLDFEILSWNAAAEKIFGYRQEEAIARSLLELIVPEADREIIQQSMRAALHQPSGICSVNDNITKDANIITCEWHNTPITNEDGNVVSMVSMATNVTVYKQAKATIRQSEQRFRKLFESLPRIAVQGYNQHRQAIFWNEASERLYGYSHTEALGRKIEDLILPRETHETKVAAINTWLEGGKFIPAGEVELCHKDGSALTVYSSHVVLRNAQDEPELYCVDIDLSDRKYAEMALRKAKADLERRVEQRTKDLQQSEAKFRRLVEDANDFTYEISLEGNFTYLSPQFTEMWGYAIAEFQNQPFAPIVHPDDLPKLMAANQKLFETGEKQPEVEFRILHKNGNLHWIVCNNSPIKDAEGKVIAFQGIARDVSDRKALEKELSRQQAYFDAFFSAANSGLAILDDQLRFVQVNQALANMDGLSIEDYIGKTPSEVLQEGGERIHAELQEVLETGQSRLDVDMSEKKPGSPEVTRYWLESHFPLLNQEGQSIGAGCILSDVTARKQAEAALQESQRKTSALLSNLQGMAYSCQDTETWALTFASEGCYELTGYRPEQFVQPAEMTLNNLIHPKDLKQVDQETHLAIQEKRPFQLTYRILTASGQEKWVMEQGRGLYSPEGTLLSVEGFITDVSKQQAVLRERNQVEAELRESQQLLQLVMDTIPQFIFWKDRNSVYLGCNRNFARAAGVGSPSEIVGKTDYDLAWNPDETEAYLVLDRQVMNSNTSLIGVIEPQAHADGKQGWSETSKVPLHDEAGNVIGILGTFQDISERVHAEQQLLLFKQAVESSSDAISIADAHGRHFYQNAAFNALYDCATVELFNEKGGMPAIFTDPLVAQEMIQTLLQGQSWVQEVEQRSLTGRRIQALVRADVIKNANGEIIGLLKATTDICDRKQAEDALRQSEQRFRDVSEAAGEYIWELDANGRYVFVTGKAKYVKGYEPSDLLGYSPFEFMPEADIEPVKAILQKAIESKESFKLEHRDIDPTGEVLWEEVTGLPILDERGEIIGFRGVGLSITERKQAEQQLQEQAQREQLLNRLTNQIRSSLDFDTILETALQEIWTLVQADRCSFAWFYTEADELYWHIIKNARHAYVADNTGRYPVSGMQAIAHQILQLQVVEISDITVESDLNIQQSLISADVRAILFVPIQTPSGMIGVISCEHCIEVRDWTDDEIELLQAVMAQLAIALNQAELFKQSQVRAQELERAMQELQRTQGQMVQSEKMSSLGQLVAGVAHEINNPVSFIYGNINHADNYIRDLLNLVSLYQEHYPSPVPVIQDETEAIDLDFLVEDLPKLLKSMKVGAERIQKIVLSLRTFSRMDEAEMKAVDIHEGIDSTLMILQNRFKAQHNRPDIQIVREYGELPRIECYAGQLNQVFMNILVNAVDALDERDAQRSDEENKAAPSTIRIRTELVESQGKTGSREEQRSTQQIRIRIADNGTGIPENIRQRLFDPFFTTKPVGKGTGMGLSISYQIVTEKHGGTLQCFSEPGQGAEFVITVPLCQE